MFKLDANRTFARDVIVMVPIDGGFREETLKTVFIYRDVDYQGKFDLSKRDETTAFLEDIVNRFEGVVDDAGQPLMHGPELRRQLFAMHFVRQALISSYAKAVSQVAEGN